MDIVQYFKNTDNSYFGRRKGLLFIFQILSIFAALINSIFSSGWLSGLTGEYLPDWLSWFLALSFAVGLEFAKKRVASDLFKELAKFKIWDVYFLSGTILLFFLSLVFALNGIDAKKAADELKRHEQDSTHTQTESKKDTNAPALSAKTLQGQINADKARTALNETIVKLEKTEIEKQDKKDKKKEDRLTKITKLKERIFSAGIFFIWGIEAFFLYSCWVIGSIMASKPDTNERPSDDEIKKEKARFVAARARYKKDQKQSDLDIMDEIESWLNQYGLDIPK